MVVRHGRMWWLANGENSVGCLMTLTLSLALLAVVAVVLWPSGRAVSVTGQVVGFGMRETEQGSYQVAYVVSGPVRDRVRLYPTDRCSVGDNITLRVIPHWWGDSLAVVRDGQPCSPRGGIS